MVDVASPKHGLEDAKVEVEDLKTPIAPPKPTLITEITRLPDYDDDGSDTLPISPSSTPSTYHIYAHHPCNKTISPTPDPTRDRRSGPRISEIKAFRKDRKSRKASGLPPIDPDPNAFFLHQPYLAFHMPPQVLYTGSSKHGTRPTVLIHQSCFWRKYKLQLGPFLAAPGVLDPRGVVSWRHNGGDKSVRKRDDHALQGYRVRTWRLWGETGKAYVKKVKTIRQTGDGVDPDVVVVKDTKPVRADEVVYLSWTSPFSKHTRRYHFRYRDVDFYWKGTGTVRESRACGWFLRFSHLKLVARVPCIGSGDDEKKKEGGGDEWVEVCVGKFTSSVAKEKSGTLELFDSALLRLVEDNMPSVLEQACAKDCEQGIEVLQLSNKDKMLGLKRSTLYQVIVATATCMIASEKEKRHTIIDLIIAAAEQGGGGGG
ncbi:hypothetical protein DE146DRAFT_47084 [Phaeosphaeria sp. MPI-PUGE-AT-0046c]|nr:hypothetical protein DE146DRAFT_47084 [Phaeosphaeria sp. MPI-PUGE-AT-0046c]